MPNATRLRIVLSTHAQRYGADDAAMAQLESLKEAYQLHEPTKKGYKGRPVREGFYTMLRALRESRIAEAAAHNALQKAYDVVFGEDSPQHELLEHAQRSRLVEVLTTELSEETKRQRLLAERYAALIPSQARVVLFGINAVISRALRHVANRKASQLDIFVVNFPANLEISQKIAEELIQVLPAENTTVTRVAFGDVGAVLEAGATTILMPPLGLTTDARLVVPRGGELLVSVAERAEVSVLVPLAPLDVYTYEPQLSHAHRFVYPSSMIKCVTGNGIYAVEELLVMWDYAWVPQSGSLVLRSTAVEVSES